MVFLPFVFVCHLSDAPQLTESLEHIIFKKYKTCTMFLSSYTNTSGSLGEREMLWEHEPQASVSTAFSSSPKLSGVFVQLDRNTEFMFSISFRKQQEKKKEKKLVNFDY